MTDAKARLDALRGRLSASQAPLAAAAPGPGAGALPMSFAQWRLWFMEHLEPGLAVHHLPSAVQVKGPLDAAVLQRALDQVVQRHGALRTRFIGDQEDARQHVEETARCELARTDATGPGGAATAAQREAAVRDAVDRVVRTPFDLGRAPLARVALIRLAAGEHMVVICLHHLVADGWSLGVFWRDLWRAYDQESGGNPVPEPTQDADTGSAPGQYADFTLRQRAGLDGGALDRSLRFWGENLAGVPAVLPLAADRPRPAAPSHRSGRCPIVFPAAVTRALRDLAVREGASLFMVLAAVYATLLHRHSGVTDIPVGFPVAGRPGTEYEDAIGLFANTVVLRTRPAPDLPFTSLLRQVRDTALAVSDHHDTPFERIVEHLRPERSRSHHPLFQVMFGFHTVPSAPLRATGLDLEFAEVGTGATSYDLDLSLAPADDEIGGQLIYDAELFAPQTAARMARRLVLLAQEAAADPGRPLADLPLLSPQEQAVIAAANDTTREVPPSLVHELVAARAAELPQAPAVTCLNETLTYQELNEAANRLAHHLSVLGAGPDCLVGVHLDRSADLVVTLLAVWRAGAAYLPLDPGYPDERLRDMLRDSGARLLVTTGALLGALGALGADGVEAICVDRDADAIRTRPSRPPRVGVGPANLAYTIYTSGSTGRPKGVMVEHGNLRNLLTALDGIVPRTAPRHRWLAITSVSFDISVLELFWPLSHGDEVVLQAGDGRSEGGTDGRHELGMSLFYFGADDGTQPGYDLLLEGARFADRNGFTAVWTPERHFHAFGGRYPNPAVTSAAVASVTERIGIRAGSVVLPLHDPLRVAETWAVIDNLSGGRVGMSFASGWHPDDFVLNPDAFQERRTVMRESVATVRALWRGEQVPRLAGNGETVPLGARPRPVQPEAPVWITTGGSRNTFELAGELGANLLTHLLGQSTAELRANIAAYRSARGAYGHDPAAGTVTLMLHTFVAEYGEDPGTALKEPFLRYLRTSFGLMGNLLALLGRDPAGAAELTEPDIDFLLEQAFDRFFLDSGLIGTRLACAERAARLFEAGVDELACLVDLGLDTPTVLAGLRRLADVLPLARAQVRRSREASLPGLLAAHDVSHLQMTPSAAALLDDAPGALTGLSALLIGGEEFPAPLAAKLRAQTSAALLNMYGPTETTVWSSAHRLGADNIVPIGRPLANTQIHVVEPSGAAAPPGVPGEICIGGLGVARGYLGRPDLTAERFVPDPFSDRPGSRLYRTGDLGVRDDDGTLRFLGRADDQVKVRGHRVELHEVQAHLLALSGVREAAVLKEGDGLTAYVVTGPGTTAAGAELLSALRKRLPDYMVPNELVSLVTLPRTVSGKMDRTALAAASGARATAGADGPDAADDRPRGATEEALAEIWREVLERDGIGTRATFFELGGHSLKAMQAVGSIRRRFGIPVPLRALFDAPTIAALARMLDTGSFTPAVPVTPKDLVRDARLPGDLTLHWTGPPVQSPSDVFLTGATGFLGRVLLHELLTAGVGVVRCLVPAPDAAAARQAVVDAMMTAGLWQPDFADRIAAVPGNLTATRFGLAENAYTELAERTEAVYHAGALVHMLYPYALLKPANVDGTAQALRLACTGRSKVFHHVSSLDVFPDAVPHREDIAPDTPAGLSGAYAQSKWVAEAMVRAAGARGLPTVIYRPGNVAGHSGTGYWNTNDALYTLLVGCLNLGAAPAMDVPVVLTPVDYVARAIVRLSAGPADGRAYHLFNPHPALPWQALVEALGGLGHPLRMLPYDAWRARSRQAGTGRQLSRALELNAELSGEAEAAAGRSRARRIEVTCDAALAALAGSPIQCPPTDQDFLSVFLTSWAEQGVIPPPRDNSGVS